MRNLHRWVMTVFAVMLVYWTASGLLMAIYDATDGKQVWAIEGGGPGARLTDFATNAAPLPDPESLTTGIATAVAAMGERSIASANLRVVPAGIRLQLAEASGDRDTMGRFFADSGAAMTALQADGDPDANVPAYVTQRNTLKAWHRGNIVGFPGQFLGLFTGLALITLTITGAIVYLQLWKSRRKFGKPGFFWNTRDSLWRRLHRWISIVAAAFILNIAISGSILAYSEIQLNLFLQKGIGAPPYPRPSPMPAVSAAALPKDVGLLLQTTYRAALADHPASSIVDLQIVMRDGLAKGLVTIGGAMPSILAFDAQTGASISDWAVTGKQVGNGYYADWHQAMKRIHRGDIIGSYVGRYIDIIAGVALLYLVISGVVMYVQMLQKRKQLQRGGWFWK
ncbi:MAG: PepSY-associated TM helix domain-containing protein [Steroidobacteraceae bacterium]